MRYLLTLLSVSVLTFLPSTSFACSIAGDYSVPTNLELVAEAETIILARVSSSKSGEYPWETSVFVTPEVLLKGNALPPKVEIHGAHLGDKSWSPTKSKPRELRKVNPDALTGGCVRRLFSKDMRLVLFLSRDEEGNLVPYRSPFSRDSEYVVDENALWVKAVKEYVKISAFPKLEWKQRMRSRISELREKTNDPDALAIAKDMDIEIQGKKLKPYD
jgi:hypothetical protein